MKNHGTFIVLGKIIDLWKFRWNFHHWHLVNHLCSLLLLDVSYLSVSLNIFLTFQHFRDGLDNASVGDANRVTSAFPMIRILDGLGILVFSDRMSGWMNITITTLPVLLYFIFKLLTVATWWMQGKVANLKSIVLCHNLAQPYSSMFS